MKAQMTIYNLTNLCWICLDVWIHELSGSLICLQQDFLTMLVSTERTAFQYGGSNIGILPWRQSRAGILACLGIILVKCAVYWCFLLFWVHAWILCSISIHAMTRSCVLHTGVNLLASDVCFIFNWSIDSIQNLLPIFQI